MVTLDTLSNESESNLAELVQMTWSYAIIGYSRDLEIFISRELKQQVTSQLVNNPWKKTFMKAVGGWSFLDMFSAPGSRQTGQCQYNSPDHIHPNSTNRGGSPK